ncbi:Probable inactive ATP-dependent zinc metalloprotease FTSHI 3, chloroplastic [Linum perenne]
MSAFSLVCSIGSLRTKENSGTFSVKPRPVTRYSAAFSHYLIPSVQLCKTQQFSPCTKKLVRSASSENNGVRLLGFGLGYRSWHGFSCSNRIGPLVSSNNGVEPTQLRKGISKLRKRFSLRLRPRLRLLTMRMKRIRVRSVLSEFILFLKKNLRRVVLYASISIGLAMCYLFLRLAAEPSSKIVPYSDFIACLQNGSVSEVLLVEESRGIYYNIDSQGTLINPNSDDQSLSTAVSKGVAAPQTSRVNQFGKVLKPRESKPKWEFATRKMDHDDKFLLSLLREKGATYRSAPQSVWMSMSGLLLTIIALWIPLTPLMWLLHRQLSANNSLAKKRRPTNRTVTFNDVDGVDAAKAELIEIVSCLQGAIKYQRLGAKLPRGVLLVGPPGTGKTLLARAVAGEAGVPFFSVSASEFVELFVGRGAARIRDLFNTARKSAPSIIFIDELDAVGGRRGRSFNDERDQTLNQLLTEMDGFESEMRVVVIAATNRPEALDPALCRPGRFSRKVLVGEPDEEGRRKILAIHLREVPLEEDPDLISDLVASLTPGLVGADLANIVNEAALLAARRGGESVAREDVMEAIERAKFGINDKKLRPSTISKEIGKLFPWVLPSLVGKKQDDTQGPLGYPTMS